MKAPSKSSRVSNAHKHPVAKAMAGTTAANDGQKPKLIAYAPQFVQTVRVAIGRRPHDDVAQLVAGLERLGVPVMVAVSDEPGAKKREAIAYPQQFVQGLCEYFDNTMLHREARPIIDMIMQGGVAVDAPELAQPADPSAGSK